MHFCWDANIEDSGLQMAFIAVVVVVQTFDAIIQIDLHKMFV